MNKVHHMKYAALILLFIGVFGLHLGETAPTIDHFSVVSIEEEYPDPYNPLPLQAGDDIYYEFSGSDSANNLAVYILRHVGYGPFDWNYALTGSSVSTGDYFSLPWGAADGDHLFRAQLFNEAGQFAEKDIEVYVSSPFRFPRMDSFTVSDSTPSRGQWITLSGTYSDSDGNLLQARISDMGSGNHLQSYNGAFTPIGQEWEPLSGHSGTMTRQFRIPTNAPLGPYTFRYVVFDHDGNSGSNPSNHAIRWRMVHVVE